jgi:RNA polymerase sigma factor (sigma-70 family)
MISINRQVVPPAQNNERVVRHLHLVKHVARRYNPPPGMSRQDLVQEGRLGLIRADQLYDTKKGAKYETYAYRWIKHFIIRAIMNESDTVRLPINVQDYKNKIEKTQNELLKQLGRLPSEKELVEKLVIGEEDFEVAQGRIQKFIKKEKGKRSSLDGPANNKEDGLLLHEKIPANDLSPDETIFSNKMIKKLMPTLPPKEKRIMELRFGLDTQGYGGMTLQEVGDIVGFTRERVRQVEEEAKKYLKVVRRLGDFTPYLPWLYDEKALDLILRSLDETERALFEMTFVSWVSEKKVNDTLSLKRPGVAKRRQILTDKIDKMYAIILEVGFTNITPWQLILLLNERYWDDNNIWHPDIDRATYSN